MQATVFVPEGRLELFLRKIAAYRNENTTPRSERGVARPKNQDFVESISNIRGSPAPALELRPVFERFFEEIAQSIVISARG